MDPFTQADVVNIIFIILPTHTRDEVDYLDKLADELAQDKPMEKILESRISYVLGEDWEIISLLNWFLVILSHLNPVLKEYQK